MGFGEAVSSGFQKYVTFSGRAARSEYWFWYLFTMILSVVTLMSDRMAFPDSDLSPVNSIASLVVLLPSIALCFRRLHDIGRTAWWVLLVFTGIGVLVLIYWACVKGTNGPNMYGPDPLAGQPQ
jgi:uncharacterized membrane protein YhaH (DUF805 family)